MNVVKGSFEFQIRRMAHRSGFGQPRLVPIAAGVYSSLRNPLIYKAEWFFADQSVHLPRRQTGTARQPSDSRETAERQPLKSHATHSVPHSTTQYSLSTGTEATKDTGESHTQNEACGASESNAAGLCPASLAYYAPVGNNGQPCLDAWLKADTPFTACKTHSVILSI